MNVRERQVALYRLGFDCKGIDGIEGPITLALDAAENVYVHGGTVSDDFPTTPGAFLRSGRGAFVVRVLKRIRV